MSENVSSTTIRKTQESLGKFVKKPPLTEKLLRKPPFRFLHDIITAVIRDTGFMEGLFLPEEMKSENVKDKESKLAFLQKFIDVVKNATGEQLTVRPTKIVAGHEVEKTNLLLQALGRALETKLDSTEAVQAVLGGKTKTPTKKLKEESKKTIKTESKNVNGTTPRRSNGAVRGKSQERSRGNEGEKKKAGSTSVDKAAASKKESKSPGRSKATKETRNGKGKEKEKAAEKIEDIVPVASVSPLELPETEEQVPEIDTQIPEAENEVPETDQSFPILDVQTDDQSVTNINSGMPSLTTEGRPDVREDVSDFENQRELDLPLPAVSPGPSSLVNGVAEDFQLSSMPPSNSTPEVPVSRPATSLKRPISAKLSRRKQSSDNRVVVERSSPLEPEQKSSPVPMNNASALGDIIQRPPTRATPTDAAESEMVLGGNSQELTSPTPGPSQTPLPTRPPTVRPGTSVIRRPHTGVRSARPPSARPAAPRIRDRGEVIVTENDNRPTTAKVTNVIVDNSNNEEEDDEVFVVEEAPSLVMEEAAVSRSVLPTDSSSTTQEVSGEQGHLVDQILNTQKELEEGRTSTPEPIGARKVEIEYDGPGGESGRLRERESARRDVDKLRSAVQTLTRAANPLGKLTEFLQEDVDAMQRELTSWKMEYKQLLQELKKEQSITEQSVEPLKVQLSELEQAIQEQRDKISAVKASILTNDEKILRLMRGLNLGGN